MLLSSNAIGFKKYNVKLTKLFIVKLMGNLVLFFVI